MTKKKAIFVRAKKFNAICNPVTVYVHLSYVSVNNFVNNAFYQPIVVVVCIWCWLYSGIVCILSCNKVYRLFLFYFFFVFVNIYMCGTRLLESNHQIY